MNSSGLADLGICDLKNGIWVRSRSELGGGVEAFQKNVKYKRMCRVGENVQRRTRPSLFKDSRKGTSKIIKMPKGD